MSRQARREPVLVNYWHKLRLLQRPSDCFSRHTAHHSKGIQALLRMSLQSGQPVCWLVLNCVIVARSAWEVEAVRHQVLILDRCCIQHAQRRILYWAPQRPPHLSNTVQFTSSAICLMYRLHMSLVAMPMYYCLKLCLTECGDSV